MEVTKSETRQTTHKPLNACHVLIGEISTVVSALRFSPTPVKQKPEPSSEKLVNNLAKLQKTLESLHHRDIFLVDTLEYLQPFLDVIKSDETSGPITAVALTSVHKFLQCGFLCPECTNPAKGIRAIVAAVARCRFKATNRDTDQVVLFQILRVLLTSLTSPVGYLLTNKLVYEMAQTCFKMSIQKHLSVLLRKAAEMTLMEMVQWIFSSFNGQQDLNEASIDSLPTPPTTPLNPRIPAVDSLDGLTGLVGDLGLSEENRAQILTPRSGSNTLQDERQDSASASSPRKAEPATPTPAEVRQNESQGKSEPFIPSPEITITPASPKVYNAETAESDNTVTTGVVQAGGDTEDDQEDDNKGKTIGAYGKTSLDTSHQDTDDKKVFVNSQGITFSKASDFEENQRPFSSLGLVKLLSFFSGLVNDARKTESMKMLGLMLINTVIETQGLSITKNQRLYDFVKDDLFKTILQALHDTKKPDTTILGLLLRVFFNLFVALGSDLKFQLNVFFMYSLGLLNDAEKTSSEQRELILGTILQMLKEPSFAVDLYINYDCDMDSDDVFGELIEFFYKHACTREPVPSGAPHPSEESPIMLMCLDGFFCLLQSFYRRLKLPCVTPSVDKLKQTRQLKAMLQVASEYFKEKPVTGLNYLQEKGLLPVPHEPKRIALFLRNTRFLSKSAIGEYLGKPSSGDVLKEYVKTFPMEGNVRLIDAVRAFFESFRPLGESQVIERYIEAFVSHFLEVNNTLPSNLDDTFTLIYSIIMLNVDLHSPNLVDRPKMTLAQYTKNLDGINGGKDFDLEFLTDIYNTVNVDEIKIHREHLVQGLADRTWYHLYREANMTNQSKVISFVNSLQVYDPLVFNSLWRKLNATLKFFFNNTRSQEVQEKILACFQMCALICSHYNLNNCFDDLIITLCELSTITALSSRRFAVMYALNSASLVSASSLVTWKDTFGFPNEDAQPPQQPQASGFASWFAPSSWFGMSGGKEEEQLTEAQRKLEEVAKATIKQCKLEGLVQSSCAESFLCLVKVLVTAATPTPLSSASPSQSQGQPPAAGMIAATTKDQSPDLPCVFAMKVLTEVLILNKSRVTTVWEPVSRYYTHVASYLQDESNFHLAYSMLTSFLVLSKSFFGIPEIRPTLFTIFRSLLELELDKTSFWLQKARKKLAVGVRKVFSRNIKYLTTKEDWKVFFSFVRWASKETPTISDGVDLLSNVIMPQPRTAAASNTSTDDQEVDNFRTHMNLVNFHMLTELISIFMAENQKHKSESVSKKLLAVLTYTIHAIPRITGIADGTHLVPEKDVIAKFLIPTFQYTTTFCLDVNLGVCSLGLSTLQRSLLSHDLLLLSTQSWVVILNHVVFPLMNELLKAPSGLSPDVLEERYLRAAQGILCKTFLQYLSKLIESPEFLSLWKNMLQYLEMYLKVGAKSELLKEAVSEAFKNILMVMQTAGILTPDLDHEKGAEELIVNSGITRKQLWDLTWVEIDRFLPNLKKDMLPSNSTTPKAAEGEKKEEKK